MIYQVTVRGRCRSSFSKVPKGKTLDMFGGLMELYHLKTFIAVATESHITRAAKKMNISQPSVSAHIKALEHELGICLFERSKKGMHLTTKGALLLKKAEVVINSLRDFLSHAGEIKEEAVGRVKMGINLDSNILRITQLFEHVRSKHPGLTLRLIRTSSRKLERLLGANEIDCGYILGEATTPDIETYYLQSVDYMVAGPVSWAKKLKEADAKDIAQLPWVVHTQGCRLDLLIEKHLGVTNQKLIRAVEADDDAVSRLIMAEAGVGLMHKYEAQIAAKDGKIALWQNKILSLNLFFAYLKKRKTDPRIKALLNIHKQIW